MSFLADLVGMLSESGLNALRDRRAEQELQRSQEVLHAVLDAIPARVFWKDNDLRYLGANTPFARDAGYETPDGDHRQGRLRHGAGATRRSCTGPTTAPCSRGVRRSSSSRSRRQPVTESRLTLLTSKVPLRDAAGDVIGVLGTYMDVTERARAQREAEETRELLHYVVAARPERRRGDGQRPPLRLRQPAVPRGLPGRGPRRDRQDALRGLPRDPGALARDPPPGARRRGGALRGGPLPAPGRQRRLGPLGVPAVASRRRHHRRHGALQRAHHGAAGGGRGAAPEPRAVRDVRQRHRRHRLPQGRPAALHHGQRGQREVLRARARRRSSAAPTRT